MTDVTLRPASIGSQNSLTQAHFAAQDLEGQPIGNVVPFTYSQEQGFVFLGFDFITFTPVTFNEFDGEDLEELPVGPINFIPATPPPSVFPFIYFLEGDFFPVANDGNDDFESYAVGTITTINNSVSLGDVTMFVGQCRPYP